jgi:hypothetical protein
MTAALIPVQALTISFLAMQYSKHLNGNAFLWHKQEAVIANSQPELVARRLQLLHIPAPDVR